MKSTMNTIIGLSLVTVGSAALLYLYLRKKDKDKDDFDATDGTIKQPSDIRKSFILQNSQIPLVVGRNGATLNSIEMKTNTRIKFQENDENTHTCEIVGQAEHVELAENLIQKEAQRPTIITEEITVPQNACGKIMGRCGDTLSEICRKSLAKVWIEPGTSRSPSSTPTTKIGEETKRRVLITGTQGQVNAAKSLIEEKVKEDAMMREQLDNLEKREPRVRTPPSSAAGTSTEVREILPPKQEKLAPTGSDGQLEVFVSACENPSRFWLQLVGPQSTELDIMVETMTEYYNQADNQDLHRIREPYLGQIVAAMFNLDNKWYRAEIVAIQPNDFNPAEIVLDLYFVDYGDSQFARPHEVLELRADFLGLRFQAIEVFLANVVPANETTEAVGNNAEWDASAITRFDELTHGEFFF
jgi:tudor domain-containing protein 2